MKNIARICRFLVGCLFIFSGFVKSVDPYGTAYKMTEYLSVWGFDSLVTSFPWLPIFGAVVLCSLEFVVGLCLVGFVYKKQVNWIVSLMMFFFTVLTFIDALTNKVSDCGCFGDAVKLTNWQTFGKNIVLDILLIIAIVFQEKNKKSKGKGRCIYVAVVSVLVLGFTIFNAMFEPVIDFRPWKEGNRMVVSKKDQKPPVAYVQYKNNKTGKTIEWTSDELMAQYTKDSQFDKHWTFVDSRVVNVNSVAAPGFSMTDVFESEDKSYNILAKEGYTFIFPVVILQDASTKAVKKVAQFQKQAKARGCQTALITSSPVNQWNDFIRRTGWSDVVMYSTDDKAIETMMRSNPGVVMLKDGVVIKKWSWRCLPDFASLNIPQQKIEEE